MSDTYSLDRCPFCKKSKREEYFLDSQAYSTASKLGGRPFVIKQGQTQIPEAVTDAAKKALKDRFKFKGGRGIDGSSAMSSLTPEKRAKAIAIIENKIQKKKRKKRRSANPKRNRR